MFRENNFTLNADSEYQKNSIVNLKQIIMSKEHSTLEDHYPSYNSSEFLSKSICNFHQNLII